EPLAGYLLLGQRLLEGRPEFAEAWNFGPDEGGSVPVESVVRAFQESWPRTRYTLAADPTGPHETKGLKLDSGKARERLRWRPLWDWSEAIARTAQWYRAYYEMEAVSSREDLGRYLRDAERLRCGWASE